tara:strand:- start:2009 stop:3799 length:1791 start_codon:yes stop_codon:yes gene_type:complete
MIQSNESDGGSMGGDGFGLDISARQRYARIFKLGNRKEPLARTPALILYDNDSDLPVNLAPFQCSRIGDSLPPNFLIKGRGPLSPPFEEPSPIWEFKQGNVLPPTLSETEIKSDGSSTPVLSLSLQRMMQDSDIVNLKQPSLVIVTDAVQLANRSKEFVEAMLIVRETFPSALIWCPGLSGPDNIALLTWLGVDLHDLSRSRQAHSAGMLLTSNGLRNIELDLEGEFLFESQIEEWKNEIVTIRESIRKLKLRELVEKRVLNYPKLVEQLRFHDYLLENRKIESLTRHASRERVLQCNSLSVRSDPIIREWTRKISSEYVPHKSRQKLLILLPCSAKKPYRISRSHKKYRYEIGNISATEISITSPLGLVPRELEELWPAANYDVPVTGHWDAEEIMIVENSLSRVLDRVKFELIINHSGFDLGTEFCGIKVIETNKETFSAEVKKAKEELGIQEQSIKVNRMIEYQMISKWHYGSYSWLDGTKLAGKPPHWKIEKEGKPFARWNHLNSSFSFSKAALPILAGKNTLPSAKIKLDGDWNGDVFAPMVISFDNLIRVGDVVLLYSQDDTLIGSGIAQAPAWEWNNGCGRLAKVRHRL